MPSPESPNNNPNTGESINNDRIKRKLARTAESATATAVAEQLTERLKKDKEYKDRNKAIQEETDALDKRFKELQKQLRNPGDGHETEPTEPTPEEKKETKEKAKNHRGFKKVLAGVLVVAMLAFGGIYAAAQARRAKANATSPNFQPKPAPITAYEAAPNEVDPIENLGMTLEGTDEVENVEAENAETENNEVENVETGTAETEDGQADSSTGGDSLGGIFASARDQIKNFDTSSPDLQQEPAPVNDIGITWEEEDTEAENAETKNAQFNIEKAGAIKIQEGEIDRYTYSGGYHPENDPRNGFEETDAYGSRIEGDTLAERVSNYIKRVIASPEALMGWRLGLGLEDFSSMDEENARANNLRAMSADEFDKIVNETLAAFYNAFEGGHIGEEEKSNLIRIMTGGNNGGQEDIETHGREEGHNEVLFVFYNKDGVNIFENGQRRILALTIKDAGARKTDYGNLGINFERGGNMEWREGMEVITSVYQNTPQTPSNPSGGNGGGTVNPPVTPAPKNPGAEIANAGGNNTQQGAGTVTTNPGVDPGRSADNNTQSDRAGIFSGGNF